MFSPEAMKVLTTRYLREHETPEGMFQRVANHVAAAETAYGGDRQAVAAEYFQLMNSLSFLPNTPTLINAGKPQGQLAACFVLPVEDSLEGIFETLKQAALIHQSGGGTGFSFSRVRPRGERVATTGNTASGPVSFIQLYDAASDTVKQGAVRSGANMAVLRVDHPDIMEFITVKQQRNLLTNFNLSVAVTDDFMAAVAQKRLFNLIHPQNARVMRQIPARKIMDRLVEMAWENGEPGLFFIDTVNKDNPTPGLGAFESPNPCSEQPLLPYESCTLGSINLTKVLKVEGKQRKIDFERLRSLIRAAVKFLDQVIDVNSYPLKTVADTTRLTRKIGLGIMGLADIFILMDIPYASQQAVDLTARIMEFVTGEARKMSVELAGRRGSFPAFAASVYKAKGYSGLRNATVTTIAPTGSISIIAGCSSGIEPLFALSLTRRVLEGETLSSTNPVVLEYLAEKKLLSADVEAGIRQGSVRDTSLPQAVKQVLATAHEIAPYWHVAQLAAAQRFTDNGVSKTVNLPVSATTEDVDSIFMLAYNNNCKGVTVYRDLSRSQQVLTHGTTSCSECSENF